MRLYLCLVLLCLPGSFCQFENSTELIEGYGLPAEEHEVVTEDGYIITIFRIPKPGARVFVVDPGIPFTSDSYIVSGDTSIGYVMYDAGYDVWLANHRGGRYGRQRVNSRHSFFFQKSFWDFSLDEVAYYDESAIIDYILNVTQKQNLSYIGHSSAPAAFLALVASRPEYNSKIQTAFFLAPAVYPVKQYYETWIDFGIIHLNTLTEIMRFFFIYEAFPRSPIDHLLRSLCIKFPDECRSFVEYFLGSDWHIQEEYFPLQITHLGDGMTSINHIRQIANNIKPGGNTNFTKYDYGKKMNKVKYGTETPPLYDLSQYKITTFIMVSRKDSVIDEYSVDTLKSQIEPRLVYVQSWDTGHLDYLYKMNTGSYILDFIKRYKG